MSQYDGPSFTTFTKQDGLASDNVRSIFQNRAGMFWFGTSDSGVSRYDGQSFTTFATHDGLGHN